MIYVSKSLVTLLLTCSCAVAQVDDYHASKRSRNLARDVSITQPPVVFPSKDSTSTTLAVVKTVSVFDGMDLEHRSYNYGLVGPTIRVNPGQRLNVRLVNRLPAEPIRTNKSNKPHGFNTTNLHTHGLHVSPRSPADDVFRRVAPGQSFDYVFDIPRDHPAGTFWYHAHKHGSTALQLASGMAGALIVNGGLDNIGEIREAREYVMVLQQWSYRKREGLPAVVDPDLVYSQDSVVSAINGVVTPTIVMHPGEVQRWRLVHAGTAEQFGLNIEGVDFYEIAVDGLATGRLRKRNRIVLYPGNRVDVLVKAPNKLGIQLMYSTVPDPKHSLKGQASGREDLLRLVVQGEPKPMKLPSEDNLRKVAAFTDADVPKGDLRKRRLVFSQDGNEKFYINGRPFDPTRIEHKLTLGDAEEWELVSESGVHPFHIHVNPFAVKPFREGDPWSWRDTIVVRKGRPVTLRTKYQRFTGFTVLHCHNLIHEDHGMMQRIELIRSKSRVNQASGYQPKWEAVALSGQEIESSELLGNRYLLVLHKGISCVHCADQLITISEQLSEFKKLNVSVVAISSAVPEDAGQRSVLRKLPYLIGIDPSGSIFSALDCRDDDGTEMHGLFLIDHKGIVRFRRTTDVAEPDPLGVIQTFLSSEKGIE